MMTSDILSEVKRLIINARLSYYDWLKKEEMEATEREQKIEQVKALSSALTTRREVAEVYATNFFEDRRILREMAEKVLSDSIESGDTALAEMSIELIKFEYEKDLFAKINNII
jgi:hypothetical protein